MTEPAFTVVMPAFNAEATVAAAIRSALAQTRPDFEVLVINDGSTDSTSSVARSFESDSRVRVIDQPNRGLPAARNAAIASSNAPFLCLLDSDDLWMPNYLERMGAAIEARDDVGFVHTDAWVFLSGTDRVARASAAGPYQPSEPIPQDPEGALRLLVRQNYVYVGTTIRRAALESAGIFNETLCAAEDYELWMRILANGFRTVSVPGRLAIRRDRDDSMTSDRPLMYEGLRDTWQLVADEHPAPADVKATARERMRWAQGKLDAANTSGTLATARRRALGIARAAKRRTLDRRLWLDAPPPEVSAAFPSLRDL